MTVIRHQTQFTDAMVAACGAALDADLFYDREFTPFVVQHMGGIACAGIELDELMGPTSGHWEFMDAVEARIRFAARGHFILLKFIDRATGAPLWQACMSDGVGIAPGGRNDAYDARPDGSALVARMTEYEIYLCRKYVQHLREAERGQRSIDAFNIKAGAIYRNYKAEDGRTVYSTVEIREVNYKIGSLVVFLRKRGSAQCWVTTVHASLFIKLLKISLPALSASEDFQLANA